MVMRTYSIYIMYMYGYRRIILIFVCAIQFVLPICAPSGLFPEKCSPPGNALNVHVVYAAGIRCQVT